MPPEEPQPSPHIKSAQDSLQLAFGMLAQIGLLTVGVVLFAIIGGLALDRALETKPLFTALLVVGSFPFTFYIIYRVAMQAVAKIPAPPRGAPRAKEVADRDDDR